MRGRAARGAARSAGAYLALLCVWPSVAAANGLYSHAHVSQLAVQELPEGPIRALLEDPELYAALEAGSIFPDSGYAVSPSYGEPPHWEPFVIAYVASLRARYAGDFSSREAQRELAFLLGIASHGMTDQSYDTTLLARTAELEPEDSAVPYDTYADYFVTIDQGVRFEVASWAPWSVLPPLFEGMDASPDEAELMEGMRLASLATSLQSDPVVATPGWDLAWEHYPFLGTYIYDRAVVGSLPWLAALVARYWEVLWARVHGDADVDRDLLIGSVPEDGAVNWPVSAAEDGAFARIGVWFGWGMPTDETRLAMRLVDDGGEEVQVTFTTAYGGRDRSLIFLTPDAPLRHDAVYTVEVDAGVRTLSDELTTVAYAFSFRTRCADDALADCPPLPAPLAAGPQPPRPPRPGRDAGPPVDAGVSEPVAEGCGCRASGGGACDLSWLAAVALLVRARARRTASRGGPSP